MAEFKTGLFYAITSGTAKISPEIRANLPESIKRLYPEPAKIVAKIRPQILQRIKGAPLARLEHLEADIPVVVDASSLPARKPKIYSIAG